MFLPTITRSSLFSLHTRLILAATTSIFKFHRNMKSGVLSYTGCEESHFLDSCFLCRKSLDNCDIYMYRGNTPFCSQECRQEQIEIDEGSDNRWKVSSSKRSSTNSTKKTSNKSVQTSTITVA